MRYSRSIVLSFGFGAVLAACGDDGSGDPNPPADGGLDGGVPSASVKPSVTSSSTAVSSSTVVPTATPSSVPSSMDGGVDPDSSTDVDTGAPEAGSTASSVDPMITPPDASVPGFIIESPNFDDGEALPDAYTCEGKAFGGGYSPELNWSGAPEGTVSYALVFRDTTIVSGPPGNRFRGYHYVLWNVPATFTGIPEHLGVGAVLNELGGAEQFRGGPAHDPEFFGACPSWRTFCAGAERVTDTYEFVLYSFDTVQTPPAPETGVNYGMALESYFEATAVAKTVLNATSNAAPTSVSHLTPEQCPANAVDGGAVDSGAGDGGADGSVDPVPDGGSTGDGGAADSGADSSMDVDGSLVDAG
jgi:phosphatidylethanolamine-binding protein (PEBP) family uncharacterized protein